MIQLRRTVTGRRDRAAFPAAAPEQRCYGSLAALGEGQRRPLRPIASTALEVATHTGELLAELVALPGVRIFRGVRPVGTDLPPTAHVISAGRQVVLLESVAWPPGRYETAQGRVHCDGTYIGQSVGPLLAAVQHWRRALPRNHRVCAVVIVHLCSAGDLTLPVASRGDLAWVRAEDALRDVRRRIALSRPRVRARVLAALIAATEPGPGGSRVTRRPSRRVT